MVGFKDIVGQEQIKAHLQNALETGKISHAYIINGEKSSGKEFIAKLFAATLQCEQKGMDPCGECHSCKQAQTDNQPDIIKVIHEKPNVIGVDDIREQINGQMAIKPYSSKYKIFIVNEAEKMNTQAQNALLKTLEEPPEYGIIILLTANINAMLPTILSRCVVLNMRPVSDKLVKDFLMKEMEIPDYKAEVCVAFARGNLGKAKLLASSEEFDNIKSDAVSLMKNIHDMEIQEVCAALKRINEYKLEINDYLDILMVWYRDILLFKATADANPLVFREEIQAIRKAAQRSSYEGIETVIEAIGKAKSRISANVNFELTVELMLLVIKENG